jgi:hypothetical protein
MLCSEPPAAFKGGHVVKRADKFHFSGPAGAPRDLPLSVFILVILATDERTAATLSFRHTDPAGAETWLAGAGVREWPIDVSRHAHNLVVPWSTGVAPGYHQVDLVVDGERVSRLFFTIDYVQDSTLPSHQPLAN